MESVEPKDLKIRLRISIDTTADKMAFTLGILSKIIKEEGIGKFFLEEIRYLGGNWDLKDNLPVPPTERD